MAGDANRPQDVFVSQRRLVGVEEKIVHVDGFGGGAKKSKSGLRGESVFWAREVGGGSLL